MGSCLRFSGHLGEERPHQRLQLLAAAAGTLVVPALPLANGQGQSPFLLAVLTVELVVGHGLGLPRRRLAGSCGPLSSHRTNETPPPYPRARRGSRGLSMLGAQSTRVR